MEEPKQKGSKEEGRAPENTTPHKQDGDSISRHIDIGGGARGDSPKQKGSKEEGRAPENTTPHKHDFLMRNTLPRRTQDVP